MYRETLDDTPLHVKDAALPGPSEAAGLALSSGPPQSHATRANTSKASGRHSVHWMYLLVGMP